MNLLLAVMCEQAAMNPDGKLDIHGVITDLFAAGFPARQDQIVLAMVLEWDSGDHGRFAFQVDLLTPSGQPSVTLSGQTDVDARPFGRPPARTQLIMPLETLVFPTPGPYRLRVRVKGREVERPILYLAPSSPGRAPE